MSLATMHMTDIVTVWTLIELEPDPADPYSGGQSWVREVLPCEFESGGKTQTDANGAEFQPATTIYTVSSIPRGRRVKIGSHDNEEPPADAETVRQSGAGTSLSFQVPEYTAWTG